MKRLAGLTLTAAVMLSSVAGCTAMAGLPTEVTESSVTELGEARPQDDFYRYVNQEALANAEFEYGDTSAGSSFDPAIITEELEGIVQDVVAGSGYEEGSEEYIIKSAYDLYMAYDFENTDIPSDLQEMIDRIYGATTIDELLEADADLVRDYDTMSILGITPDINPFVPEEMVMSVAPMNNMLGISFAALRDGDVIIDYVKTNAQVILITCAQDSEATEEPSTNLAYLTLDIFAATDMDVLDDPGSYEYKALYSAAEVEEVLSNIDLNQYISRIGYNYALIDEYCISDIDQLAALNEVFVDENIEALKAWELSILYNNYSAYIAPHYPELSGYISRDYNTPEQQALNEVIYQFSAMTDPLYVEQYYTEETDAALRGMCDDIKEGYRVLIGNADWLSEETRSELLTKLENIVYVTGTNVTRHEPDEYSDIGGDNYYEFYLSYVRHNQQDMVASFGEPLSRERALMEMQTVNACYQPSFNNITITVAITNAPFFDYDANYFTNLGGLGMVIAHEMGHAFDSNGILFDSTGIYDPSWIPSGDMEIINTRNEQAVSYFEDNFTVFGVYHVDGEQTLGENYADLGAMECITSLCSSDEERMLLFENYAVIWCSKSTDDAIIDQIAYDVHCPSIIRVNAILSTLDVFYETYGVSEGDGMYIAPENRISRWY